MTKVTKAQQKAAQVLARKKEMFIGKVRTLIGHDIFERWSLKKIVEAFEAGETAESYAAMIASKEPVGLAIHPMKVDAIEAADKNMREYLENLLFKLNAAGDDLHEAFPYPKYNDYSDEARSARNVHNLVSYITEDDENVELGRRQFHTMTYKRVKCEERFERKVNEAREMAAIDYDSFIIKLVGKVGKCVDATIEGSHIWGYSFLTVTKEDGSKEVWKTQTILNFSKYGLPFNQWPSRKMK